MNAAILIGRGRDGLYRARCPALPGCYVTARSQVEAMDRVAEAIHTYMEHMTEVLPAELKARYEAETARDGGNHEA